MEHPGPPLDTLVRPWRTATLVASAVAALELVALVGAGIVLLGKPLSRHVRRAAVSHVFAPPKPVRRVLPDARPLGGIPKLARGETSVLVLNGNGRTGAATHEATRLRSLGYIVGGVGNAPRDDYPTSLVMYRAGYAAEAARLARDLKVKVVGPLDGVRPRDLLGAHLALVIGY